MKPSDKPKRTLARRKKMQNLEKKVKLKRHERMIEESQQRTPKVSDEAVREAIFTLCGAETTGRGVRPEEIAMSLLEKDWQSLLKRIRLMASQLAIKGYIEILRKGEPADPTDFKGLIRLRLKELPLEE